jgi:Flp pilus assembly protein TadB
MSEQQEPTLTSMIISIKDDLTSLVNNHIELAQAEAKEAVGRMAKSSGLFLTAIAMANLAGIFAFIAAAYYINTLGYELWVSFLFVVAGLTTLALILGLLAWRQLRKVTLGSRTAKSLSDTVQTLTTLRTGSK